MAKLKQSYYKFKTLPFKQGKTTLYSFNAEAKVLWQFLQINKRKEDKDEGYQRALSTSRVKAIAKYINSGNVIPNSIVVSIDKGKIDGDEILIPKIPNAGWVIDGQHRLAGAYESDKDIILNVIAFIGINTDEQVQQFVTINKEAKGVPSSLYIDLLPRLKNKKPADLAKERAADLATLLKRDEESPFSNRIVVTTAPRQGELSLANFVRKVSPLIYEGKGILATYNENIQRSVINNYFIGLKNVFPKEFEKNDSIFFKTLGFGALINALPVFFSIGLAHYKNFTVETAVSMFKKIDFFDFGQWNSIGTGNAAETQASEDIIAEITSAYSDSKGDFVIKV